MMNEQKVPQLRFTGFDDEWEENIVSDLVEERTFQSPKSEEYPLMAFIANQGVAPKGERFDRESLVTDATNKLYKQTELGDFIYSSNNLETGSIGLNKYGKATISPVYSIFKMKEGVDSDFVGRLFTRKLFINEMVKWRQGVIYGQWKIHESDFIKIKVRNPNFPEQQKIGTLLSQIDSLIQAKTQKLESIKAVKKSLLQKCFPKDGEKVPEMRFEGFSGDWEEIQFSDCFDLLTNNTLSRDELNFSGGTVKSVHYGDVLIKFPEITDVCIEKIAYISDEDIAKKYSRCLLRNGDIIIADTAEDETVGKCSEVQNCNEAVVSGLHTIPVRPKLKFAERYLGFFMNSESFHNQLIPLIQGTKVSSISKSAIENVVVRYPIDLKEQEKIGQVFSKYNELIKLQQKEIENLKTIKKSLLQKMFV